MARIREKKVLLQVLLDNAKKIKAGLCLLCIDMKFDNLINGYEMIYLRKYIKDHRPDNKRVRDGQAYYWLPGAKKPRIQWLKEQIELNTK